MSLTKWQEYDTILRGLNLKKPAYFSQKLRTNTRIDNVKIRAPRNRNLVFMEKKFFENRKEARISEIQEDVLTRELELLKEREQDLLEQLNRTRGAITSKECKLALRKGETKLIKEELAGAVKREETIKKHKEAFKKGESKLE